MSHEHENLIISLMEARKKGKTIQFNVDDGLGWTDMEDNDFAFPVDCKYRVKPEPREFLLAKWKPESDLMCNYWIIPSGDEYPERNYDYIRVREILED